MNSEIKKGRYRDTRSTTLIGLIALLLLAQPMIAGAAVYPWSSRPINVAYQDKPLQMVLREFFANMGQPVVISEKITRNVTGKFNTSNKKFFDKLKSVFGLICYYDGSIFYINDSSEAVSRVIDLGNVSAKRFRNTLARMDVPDPEHTLRIQESEGLAQVSGPPRFVEVVEEIALKLNESQARAKPKTKRRSARQRRAASFQPLDATFRVYPLKHAWAQDTTMAVAGREVVIPGVATTLRKLVGNYKSGLTGSALAARGTKRTFVQSLRDKKAQGKGPGAAGKTGSPIADPIAMVNVSLPRVEADARTNSVIIHDLPARMDRYDDLIASLDQRATMIQIEATIVDISTDSVEQLGVDFSRGGVTLALGRGSGAADQQFRDATSQFAQQAAAQTFFGNSSGAPSGYSTVVGNMGRFFLAQVNALASEGKAYVHATPSVLTMNNSEAVLENTQTFFVRVAGRDDVDLFDVTSGTILRVTPVSIEEDGKTQIKLAIRIEDGSITGRVVDDIPIVQRSTVGTRATVNEGQSLLIGGYAYSINSDVKSRIPVLGDIPALGALFRFNNQQVRRVERMFMITPRLVNL